MSDYEEMNKARLKWLRELGTTEPLPIAAFARGYFDALKAVAEIEITSARPEALRSNTVAVPRETLARWKDEIGPYWFGSDGEDEYNNDEIIALSREIDEFLAESPQLRSQEKT